ncbi:hypothetical protein H2203_007779 [Taxawa tesnikishii (nom. ined.)]|nr:hypothetical protein H2203_007779 [Dothideales sp. JES 119]
MYHRQLTPPALIEVNDFDCLASASSNDSYFYDYSPNSVATCLTTPRDRQLYDQTALYCCPSIGYSSDFNAGLQRLSVLRRSTTPPDYTRLGSPASLPSPYHGTLSPEYNPRTSYDGMTPQRPPLGHGRSVSTSAIRTHSRNTSTSSIDGSVLKQYGYPTYRNVPRAISRNATPRMPTTAMSHLIPIALPSRLASSAASFPPRPRQPSPPAVRPSRLSAELQYDPNLDVPQTSTLLEYLTAPNPSPDLVMRTISPARSQSPYFWFDIRNLRSWSDFNVSTIAAIDGLFPLLQIQIPDTALPLPARTNQMPETQAQLHDICRDHHAVKVNAALKVAQGTSHMTMRSLSSSPNAARQQPEFVSNYVSDHEKTISGDWRGRVVGIQVKYLAGLAHLQHYMREHGCRYGFIVTEIELVCVRYGGAPDGTSVPLFGFLELATPVAMKTNGLRPGAAESVQMTANLALFYLHMLAKEEPLPGQYGWKLEVGGPSGLTRQKHVDKDEWIPKPIQKEKREAKTIRGGCGLRSR